MLKGTLKIVLASIFIAILVIISNSKSFAQSSEGSKTITKNELLGIGKIDVSIEDFNFDAKFEVESYRVSIIINGFCLEELNIGPKFSQGTIKLIKRAEVGKKIYFEDIKVKYPDGLIKVIAPLEYKII